MVAVRARGPSFALRENPNVPEPAPNAPGRSVTNAAVVVALQSQPAGTLMVAVASPPVAGTDTDGVSRLAAQPAPAWVTVKADVVPFDVTVTVAARAAALLLGPMRSRTVASPVKAPAGVTTETHGSETAARPLIARVT